MLPSADAIPLRCRHCGYTTEQGESVGWRCPQDASVLIDAADLTRRPSDQNLGRALKEDFLLIGFIGEGGFGTVYRAIQLPMGRTVAVKILKPEAHRDASGPARFFREAEAIGRLNHPAIVKLYSCGEAERPDSARPLVFLVMEYIEGPTLKQVLKSEGFLDPARAVTLCTQVLGALFEAHQRNIIHRDLKPENIIIESSLTGEARARVLDFGISKIIRGPEDEARDPVRTRHGYIVGTTAYVAPELVLGEPPGSASDLYSMGIMLYELLTGRLPFEGDSPRSILRAHARDPVPPMPPALAVPDRLETVVRKALRKRPMERYPDALAFADALETAFEPLAPTTGEALLDLPFLEAPDDSSLETGPTMREAAPGGLPGAGVGVWTVDEEAMDLLDTGPLHRTPIPLAPARASRPDPQPFSAPTRDERPSGIQPRPTPPTAPAPVRGIEPPPPEEPDPPEPPLTALPAPAEDPEDRRETLKRDPQAPRQVVAHPTRHAVPPVQASRPTMHLMRTSWKVALLLGVGIGVIVAVVAGLIQR